MPILSDAELLFRAVRLAGSRARFVGITGTNGKSTTTALLAHILARGGRKVAAGGNLGPASLALKLLPDSGTYVLEMSSYMLERIATLRFDAAAMLNLSADHLDRHGDMAGYVAAKRAIFDRQTADDLAVVGVDDETSRDDGGLAARAGGACGHGVRPAAGGPVVRPGHAARRGRRDPAHARRRPRCPARTMRRTPPPPPRSPARSAWRATTSRTACAASPVCRTASSASATIGGIAFVNDSKATNADAASRALGCYDRVVWIAGGHRQGRRHRSSLAPLFPRIARAFLIGRDAPALAATLAARCVKHEIAGTLDAAVPAAFAAARAAGAPVVLLSPACASFDQFSGFDARGDRFAALVAQLARGRAA